MQHRLIPLGCLILALACPAQKQTLTTDTTTVFLATGGAQKFMLDAGAKQAGRNYWVLGSVTGTSPGIRLGNEQLPLNPDPWMDLTIALANTALLTNTNGRLDQSGKATAFFNVPQVTNTQFVGTVFHHAYVVYDTQNNVHMVSNPVSLTLVTSEIAETFTNSNQLDKDVSSGTWGSGKALPPQVGGTGIHGSFVASTGTLFVDTTTQKKFHVWSTDKQVIPANLTFSGKEETVTDGVFHFTDLVLPAGEQVVFEGSNPAVIHVRGKCQIDGRIDLGIAIRNAKGEILRLVQQPDAPGGKPNAQTNPFGFDGEGTFGQAAQPGGPGGGKGGKGGDPCLNTGANARFNGANGDDVQLKAGHSHSAAATGTGGLGTPLYPATGRITSSAGHYDVLSTYSAHTAAGGGGGGFEGQGGQSRVFQVPPVGGGARRQPNDSIRMGPAVLGGKAFDPLEAAPSGTSLDHYLIGGSGGGGGGSHPLLTTANSVRWLAGAAGAGGGGAIALRVGQDLGMKANALLTARGGSGYKYGTNTAELFNLPCPGGGGSGGAILLQVTGTVSLAGMLDLSGGAGGFIDNTKTQVRDVFGVRAVAGNGAPGYVRLETPGGARVGQLGTTLPAAGNRNVGTLTDVDTRSASQSKFYATRFTQPPTFDRYEVEVLIDGVRRVFSDDSEVGRSTSKIFDKDYAGRAHSSQPVFFQLQGATVNPSTGKVDPRTLGPWRELVQGKVASINLDRANGFRFLLTYDRSGTRSIEVRRVSVFISK